MPRKAGSAQPWADPTKNQWLRYNSGVMNHQWGRAYAIMQCPPPVHFTVAVDSKSTVLAHGHMPTCKRTIPSPLAVPPFGGTWACPRCIIILPM